MNENTYVDQFWTMILNNQVAGVYSTMQDMQAELVDDHPQEQQLIIQAYEIVRRELVGRS